MSLPSLASLKGDRMLTIPEHERAIQRLRDHILWCDIYCTSSVIDSELTILREKIADLETIRDMELRQITAEYDKRLRPLSIEKEKVEMRRGKGDEKRAIARTAISEHRRSILKLTKQSRVDELAALAIEVAKLRKETELEVSP